MNDEFIKQMNEAILNGEFPPKTKKSDLVLKVALSVHIFDHIAKALLDGKDPETPSETTELSTFKRAINYVEHIKSEKELIVEVKVN